MILMSQMWSATLARRFARQGRKYLTQDSQPTLAAARSDSVAFIRGLDRVVIDAVQRAPDVLLAIKQSVDEDKHPGRFLLTGSVNILTIKTMHESLAGLGQTLRGCAALAAASFRQGGIDQCCDELPHVNPGLT
jgi:uncharacterized protein